MGSSSCQFQANISTKIEKATNHLNDAQLQHPLLDHFRLEPSPESVILAHVTSVHGAQNIPLELAAHNAIACWVHFSHTFQQNSNCGLIIRDCIQGLVPSAGLLQWQQANMSSTDFGQCCYQKHMSCCHVIAVKTHTAARTGHDSHDKVKGYHRQCTGVCLRSLELVSFRWCSMSVHASGLWKACDYFSYCSRYVRHHAGSVQTCRGFRTTNRDIRQT